MCSSDLSSESQSRLDVLIEGEAIISVVPAPPSLAVLALGLAAHRRRRGAKIGRASCRERV